MAIASIDAPAFADRERHLTDYQCESVASREMRTARARRWNDLSNGYPKVCTASIDRRRPRRRQRKLQTKRAAQRAEAASNIAMQRYPADFPVNPGTWRRYMPT